jgi:hypothetical protein
MSSKIQLFDSAERLLLSEGKLDARHQVLWHRFGELLLVWKGYDDGSALCIIRKLDRRTNGGFRTLLGGLLADDATYRIMFYQPGPWEEQLTAAARSVAPKKATIPR